MARQLVYYVACTVDGFIAREDGSFDWALSEGEHFTDLIENFPETFPVHLRKALGVSQDARRFDTVLMGRKTYEVGLNAGITSPYEPLRQFVVSRSMPEIPHSAVHLYRGAALDLVRQLKAEEGKDIWLCGGATLAAGVFTEIDELILKINPVVIGSGIPLFDGAANTRATILTEHKVYANGFVFARYDLSVQKSNVFKSGLKRA
jgi:dihydrofolate reductase